MKRLALAALLAVAAPAFAGSPAQKQGAPAAKHGSPGKPRAPVHVDAKVDAGTAQLRVTFDAAASGVDVKVYGVKGLEVTSAELAVRDGSFAAGESKDIAVTFTAPSGERSHLAISISGDFAGGRRTAVQSFSVGEPSEAQKQAAQGNVKTTPEGERLKVKRR
jgi:hypothetical protein